MLDNLAVALRFVPLVLGFILGGWGARMDEACKFKMLSSPR